ncbi:hypothetical protein D3C86_1524850 [compost metagenome]
MAAIVFLQELGTELHGHASGHFTHGSEQRKCPSVHNRFISDGEDAFVFQRGSQRRLRCQVQVSEEDQTWTEVAVFAFERLFDLHDHLCGSPYSGGFSNQLSTGCSILFIQESAACSGSGFHQHFMSIGYQTYDSCRCNGDTVFVIFNFLGYSNNHSSSLLSSGFLLCKE